MIRSWPPWWKSEMAIDLSPPGASVPIFGPVELKVRLYGQEFANLTWLASWLAHMEGQERTATPITRSGIANFRLTTRPLETVSALSWCPLLGRFRLVRQAFARYQRSSPLAAGQNCAQYTIRAL